MDLHDCPLSSQNRAPDPRKQARVAATDRVSALAPMARERLDKLEQRWLDPKYEKWLTRGRVTAEMAVDLLLAQLAQWQDEASHWDTASERQQIVELLMVHRGLARLPTDYADLLHDLNFIRLAGATTLRRGR